MKKNFYEEPEEDDVDLEEIEEETETYKPDEKKENKLKNLFKIPFEVPDNKELNKRFKKIDIGALLASTLGVQANEKNAKNELMKNIEPLAIKYAFEFWLLNKNNSNRFSYNDLKQVALLEAFIVAKKFKPEHSQFVINRYALNIRSAVFHYVERQLGLKGEFDADTGKKSYKVKIKEHSYDALDNPQEFLENTIVKNNYNSIGTTEIIEDILNEIDLDNRDKLIVSHIIKGTGTYKDIEKATHINEQTIKNRYANVLRKMKQHSISKKLRIG